MSIEKDILIDSNKWIDKIANLSSQLKKNYWHNENQLHDLYCVKNYEVFCYNKVLFKLKYYKITLKS